MHTHKVLLSFHANETSVYKYDPSYVFHYLTDSLKEPELKTEVLSAGFRTREFQREWKEIK